jgi:1,2-diacylglycerol 3-alpha-glucosyltransferase
MHPAFRHYRDESPFIRRFPSFYTPFEPDYPIGWLWSPSLWREWRQQRFDLVHTHTPFFVGMAGASWARRTRTPLVSTFHTLYEEYLHYLPRIVPEGLGETRAALASAPLLRASGRHYDPVSNRRGSVASLRHSQAHHPYSQSRAALPTMSQEQARAALGIPQEVWMLLYVGRMAPEKNVHLLLHAMPHVVRGCPKARLWLVGPGPALESLQALADALNLNEQVYFTGPVPREQVSLYMLAADLFVFPSVTESQGLVLDEAQAAGLPCIVANGGGAPEAVDYGASGLIVEPTPEAFVDAILYLTRHPDAREQLRQAGLRKRETLSVPAVVERILQVYQQAIEQRTQP